ncbi:MAG: sarcosine oxidase subunit gamma family protein [Rhizobiaceae bacterium]
MANSPDRLSPLDELAMPVASEGKTGVELSERLCGSLIQVQAWPKTITKTKAAITKITKKRAAVVMEVGPGRWLIDDDGEELEEELRGAVNSKMGAVTGLTHGRVVVGISGSKATWVLASGIALDFDLSAFAVGETQVSHHHEIGVTIHRTGVDSFDLYVFTSYARALWGWIEKASREVGYSIS